VETNVDTISQSNALDNRALTREHVAAANGQAGPSVPPPTDTAPTGSAPSPTGTTTGVGTGTTTGAASTSNGTPPPNDDGTTADGGMATTREPKPLAPSGGVPIGIATRQCYRDAVNDGNNVLSAALSYDLTGISIIPIKVDGSKVPALSSWKSFQRRQPGLSQVQTWFRPGNNQPGIGTICGKVSGNLELLDFDEGKLFDPWCDLVDAEAPGLLAKLNIVETPRESRGYHVRYRCTSVQIPGNTKLAMRPGVDEKTGKTKNVTLIETRGEGGLGLAPGGNPRAHKTGRPYVHVAGPHMSNMCDITADERDILISAARSFDSSSAPKATKPAETQHVNNGHLRPGDDYNRRGPTWEAIIRPHGWHIVHSRGPVSYWRRPGKDTPGWSATTGHCRSDDGSDLLSVFSTNADPFPGPIGERPCSCHSKFDAYTRLNHGGDYRAAAKALVSEGYGQKRLQSERTETSAARAADDDNGAGSEEAEVSAYDIILTYLRQHYDPAFRPGAVIYSATLKREVLATEACGFPGIKVIDRLAEADDAPRDKEGGIKREALPRFFNTWARVAWRDLLDSLPDEDLTDVVCEGAEEEFRRHVTAALCSLITLAVPGQGKGSKQESMPERRRVIEWAARFGKSGPWRGVRP
jgi:hypothetical protein